MQSCTFVHHIDDTMLIMRSKQRPKKLLFKGSDGFDYPWLVKKESRGDLRKDARLMEVAGYVNEWMEKVEKIKEKNLKVLIFSSHFCLMSFPYRFNAILLYR
jgi:phosphatidylinositol kinase/protein kinase (PI-3  family)